MKKQKIALACSLVAAVAACVSLGAGPMYSGSISVPAGATNAVTEITLRGGGENLAPAVDRLVARNASGLGVGNIAFFSADFGVEIPLAATNSLSPGAGAALWPRRQYALGTSTNNPAFAAEPFTVRTLRVRVSQNVTNTPTVYTFGAIVR